MYSLSSPKARPRASRPRGGSADWKRRTPASQRGTFDTALRDFIDRLQHSPDVIAKAEAIKAEWLDDPSVAELSTKLWETTRRAILTYATQAAPETTFTI